MSSDALPPPSFGLINDFKVNIPRRPGLSSCGRRNGNFNDSRLELDGWVVLPDVDADADRALFIFGRGLVEVADVEPEAFAPAILA